MPVKPIPDGYHCVTPYLVVEGAAQAVTFYKDVFHAVELYHLQGPDGRVSHAELRIGDAPIMLAEAFPELNARGPKSFGGTPVHLLLYVEDVDAVISRAVSCGATLTRPVADQFYGDRSGMITDPFGHSWTIATHREDVSPEELKRRHDSMLSRLTQTDG